MDLLDTFAIDETSLTRAARQITEVVGIPIVHIQVVNFESDNVSVVAALEDTSHLTIHAWTSSRTILLDLLCTTNVNLQEKTSRIAAIFDTSMASTTFSIIPRGDPQVLPKTSNVEQSFKPSSIMPLHHFKEKLHEVESSEHRVEVWDVQDCEDTISTPCTDRQLFVDGKMHTSLKSEVLYHESLVHPAFIGSSLPPKRILIVGGGDGGMLREVFKWKSVESVVMVHPDKEIMRASRKFLPSLSDCVGVGTANCFDDPRLSMHEADFLSWFKTRFGDNICEKRDKKEDKLFDLAIIDWSVMKGIQGDGEDFFEKFSCALTRYGVLAVSFGEAPTFDVSLGASRPNDKYLKKLHQIQAMSSMFWHKRVYDIDLPNSGSPWSFAVGMLPQLIDDIADDKVLQNGVFTGETNGGINDFDGRPARVNLKLKRRLKTDVRLLSYDGAIQYGFRYPRADWKGVYCLDPRNKKMCDLSTLFTEDYEDDLFELHLDSEGSGSSGLVAKRDIPKNTVSGLWDAATDLELPADAYYRATHIAEGIDSPFHDFTEWVDFYGYDGGQSGGLGDRVYTGMSTIADVR